MKKRIVALGLAVLMVAGTTAIAAAVEKTISVTPMNMTINGQAVTPLKSDGTPAEVFSYDGATYVPLRYLSETLGIQVEWDPAAPNTAKLVNVPNFIAPVQAGKGGLQMGLAYGAPHGTKSFGQAYAVVQGDVIVAAFVDEFQFMDASLGLNYVPNSDADFAQGYAQGKALASKRMVADYYSGSMAKKAKSTVRIDDNFAAIQSFAVGKTIAQVEAVAGGDKAAAVDAVSGATLADTAGYLGLIAQAARNAQAAEAVEFSGDTGALRLNVAYGSAHGTRGFTAAAALTAGDKIVLSYIDEFQFVDASLGLNCVPNSDAGFADGYAEGQALASKRMVADYYSKLMADYAKSTVRIDDNYNAIQTHVNGMTITEAKALAADANAVDAVSGATLAGTADYVGVIAAAAEK